ncbi:MAG: DUF1801 domain-containing protein [Chitinophagaceae bacterium]|nr:MAG: DUF1801 domain-containing protein [Chitinophagaceae bacterium]
MTTENQIAQHFNSQPEPKREDLHSLHALMKRIMPEGRLWFDEGKDESGKVVTNPTAGYGLQVIQYADGKTKDFFQVGISANATGISVYILGIKDKTYLAKTFGEKIGKAKVTGYCIRFKALMDVDLAVLEAAIRYGVEASPTQ